MTTPGHDTHDRGPLQGGPTRTRRALALVATSLGFGVVQLDVSVVNVAVRSIGADLGGSVTSLQWVVNAYTVAFAALILSAGALGDRIGAKRVFTTGFVVFVVASAGCAAAPSVPALVAARAVQGVGAAILVPCSLSLLSHAYTEASQRARAVGLWAAGASVALSAGPLVGGLLIAVWGWRSIFLINLPLGVVAIVLTLTSAAETTRSPGRSLDVAGQGLAMATLLVLAAAMVHAGQVGFTAPVVLLGCGVAVAAAAAFVLVERHRREPMLPLGMFSSRTFSVSTALGLVVNIAFYGLVFVLSLYFQSTLGYSPLQTGLAFAPATVAVLLGNLVAGRLSEALSTRRLVIASTLLMGASLLALLPSGSITRYAAVAVPLGTLGLALGLIVPAMTAALLGSVDTARSGIASGTLNTARQTGSVVGVAVLGSLTTSSVVAGLHTGLLVSVGLAVAALALAAGLET